MGKPGQKSVAIFMAPSTNVAGWTQKVRKKINELDGVLEFNINYILNTVSISYDPDKITLAKIRKTIGTRVTPRTP